MDHLRHLDILIFVDAYHKCNMWRNDHELQHFELLHAGELILT
jgi:hypothetical protein